jgi:hypothetical protein
LVIGISRLTDFNMRSLLILLNIISMMGLVWLAIQRSRLGAPVLLDMGTPNKEAFQALGVLLGFGIIGGIMLLMSSRDPLVYVLLFTWALLSGIGLYLLGKQRTQVLSTGICYSDQFVGWNQIESYEWEESHNATVYTLSLRVRSRFSPFSIKPIRIPSKYQPAINDYLGKYVAQHS